MDDFEKFADDDFEEDEEEVEEDVDDKDQPINYQESDGGGDSDTGYDDASDSQTISEESSCQEDDNEGGSDGRMKVTGLEDLSEEQQKAKSVVKQLGECCQLVGEHCQ